MAYLKYIRGTVYENSSVSSEVTKNGRRPKKSQVSPHGTAVFLKHFLPHLVQYILLLDKLNVVFSTLQC